MVASSFLCASYVVGGEMRLKEAFAFHLSLSTARKALSNYTLAAGSGRRKHQAKEGGVVSSGSAGADSLKLPSQC